ncbi:conserved hypothetical protein [Alteracholeplasma palmae J233]|uniref:ATPase AAA-type core domain-containing protein n=1 Tax=Alteracholeplasma palmae (strain ATCC 49389 / J233) TaxID=1318466 RepID=U4KKI3_ALTPJ|nr:AAA family ATPase [Alteracholeplasma palmae]CCV64127.1 conserved hypothetical protein [Alteracholeplasma palmae J233]
MIAKITFENLLSIKNKQTIDYLSSKEKKHLNHIENYHTTRLLKNKIIIGKNDTGKTNFIKIMFYLKKIYEDGLNVLPKDFYYGQQKKELSLIEIEFFIHQRQYQYGISFNIDSKEIGEEYLYEFKQERKNKKFHFNRKEVNSDVFSKDLNADAKDRLQAYLYDLKYDRKNLLINKMKDKYIEDYKELYFFNDVIEFFENITVYLKQDPYLFGHFSYHQQHKIILQLKELDIPIQQMKYEETQLDTIRVQLGRHQYDKWLEYVTTLKYKHEKKDEFVFLMYDNLYRIIFVDQDNFKVYLTKINKENKQYDFNELSSGYRQILMYLMFFTSSSRIYLFIDDFGLNGHPTLIKKLLEKNLSKITQLTITTHNLLLLDNELLRKDELMLITKTELESKYESFETFNIRSDKNLFKWYLEEKI